MGRQEWPDRQLESFRSAAYSELRNSTGLAPVTLCQCYRQIFGAAGLGADQSGDKSPHSKETPHQKISIPPPLVGGDAVELNLVVLILNLATLIGSDVTWL